MVAASGYTKVGILGLGLIGGSIAKRLVKQVSAVNRVDVFVWNHNPYPYDDAASFGMITCDSIKSVVQNQVDFLVVATPIEALDDIFCQLQDLRIVDAEYLKNTTIIDIASVKEYPQKLARACDLHDIYVGTHPLFGTEYTGFKNSYAEMGDGAPWAVCYENVSSQNSRVQNVSDFIKQHLAGKPTFCTPQEHDEAVALSSHVPHVIAYELAGLISEESVSTELAKQLNAGSFHGATRVAHGNTSMFKGMLKYNRHEIIPLLKKVQYDLGQLMEALESSADYKFEKSLHHFIARSDEFRTHKVAKPLNAHSADGWVKCQCGKEHWGKAGAAGLFLVRFDARGKVSEVLLQHRALWSAEGGTWGTPGGALQYGESAVDGALREGFEECKIYAQDVQVMGEITRDHKDWKFTSVLACEKSGANIVPEVNDQEGLDAKWIKLSELSNYTLLSSFGRELEQLIEQVETINTPSNLTNL